MIKISQGIGDHRKIGRSFGFHANGLWWNGSSAIQILHIGCIGRLWNKRAFRSRKLQEAYLSYRRMRFDDERSQSLIGFGGKRRLNASEKRSIPLVPLISELLSEFIVDLALSKRL
jgi:hypothetical protein